MLGLPEILKEAEIIGLASDNSGLAMKFSMVDLLTAAEKTQEAANLLAETGLFFN
jgi:hypothetical protein